MNKHLLSFAIATMLFASCSDTNTVQELQLIPMPNSMAMGSGSFNLNQSANIFADTDELKAIAELISASNGGSFGVSQSCDNCEIRLVIEPMGSEEAYSLFVDKGGVTIKSATAQGVFYGAQTLIQMLEDDRLDTKGGWKLPYVDINDAPRYGYRGLHIDLSRHFYPVEFIKKCVDLAAHYKLNLLHLHLTDAGGWRIEIDKYPLLTSLTAWRPEKDYMKWWTEEGGRKYVKEGSEGAYGGYLTKDDARELVKYAAERFITVIPEIEVPAHSDEVLAAYPELSCVGEPYKSGEFCIGNEATFEFIENVLAEIVEIFPSEYIHIGGDEASKTWWKECPKCQKRMRDNGLKDVDELQSYAIKRTSEILAKHGRKLIGWDEILDGGLAEDATVMSWRGEEGGIKAAKSHHYVVMTPGSHLYFDSYQDNPATQPAAIGGYTPYLKTYDYNPTPSELNETEAKYILGAQANVWGEYMKDESHVEYMLFPRMLSLSEVVWTMPENKDVESFKFRVSRHIPILQSKNVNTFTLSKEVDITPTVDTTSKEMKVVLSSERYKPTIRYSTDGNAPTSKSPLYEGAFAVKDSTVVMAALFNGDKIDEVISKNRLDYHKAIGKKVTYNIPFYSGYAAQGESSFTNGYKGGLSYHDGQWQGFLTDIDVVIDLGEVMSLSYVSGRFMQLTGPGVYMPHYTKVYVSNDGKEYREVSEVKNDVPSSSSELIFKDFVSKFNDSARYIKFFSKNQEGFQFLDEIVVY
ncbi:MAG: family 20 glycosylhydrolase [Rikenellaceae bacterium]